MPRVLCYAVLGCAILASGLSAQEGIRRGKVKKVDASKGTITITVDGKDQDFAVDDDTRIMDAAGQPARGGLKDEGFKEGAAVMFKVGEKDGKAVLVGLKLAGEDRPNPAP